MQRSLIDWGRFAPKFACDINGPCGPRAAQQNLKFGARGRHSHLGLADPRALQADGIGLARDQFATKPLLFAENDEMVVLASEEISIRALFPDPALTPRELQAKEVRWWLR